MGIGKNEVAIGVTPSLIIVFFKFQETQSYTFDFVRVNDNGADYQPITINYKGSSLEPNLYRRAKQGLHLPVYLMNGSATLK